MKALRRAGLACLLIVMALGLWLLARRPDQRQREEGSAPLFKVQPTSAGFLIEYAEEQVPLRAITWVQGRQPSVLFAQVLTQNDRQQVTIFHDAKPLATVTVPRPPGTTEGFFRFAELKDAVLLEGGRALLLYAQGDGRKDEESLLIFLELESQGMPWAHRSRAERISYEPSLDPDGAYVFGAVAPLLRIRFPGPGKGGNPKVESIDLPAGIEGLTSLIPTGPGTFLATHAQGLSASLGPKEWISHPLPERTGVGFKDALPSLASGGGSFWWQPFPGRLFQVGKDGEAKAEVHPAEALNSSALDLDAGLLGMLGADPTGDLWFGLVPPLLQNTAPATPPEPAKISIQEGGPSAETPSPPPVETASAPSAEERARWDAHVKGGLSRVYRWSPGKLALRLYPWASCWNTLGRPGDFPVPEGNGRLRPESGGFLVGGERRVVWVPIRALGSGGDPPQPR